MTNCLTVDGNRCHGVLDEESLKNVFPESRGVRRRLDTGPIFSNVRRLVGKKIIWEVVPEKLPLSENEYELRVSNVRFPAFSSEQSSNTLSEVDTVLEGQTVVSTNYCENLSPIVVRIGAVCNPNVSILSSVPSSQMGTNAVLCGLGIRIIAVVQNHLLDIAEEGFDRTIIRTAFG